MEYREYEGDLIVAALAGQFDVITHGCNCHCIMGSGIAVPMKNTFGCDKFRMESHQMRASYNKLGTIDYQRLMIDTENKVVLPSLQAELLKSTEKYKDLYVVNSYTQYRPGQSTPPYSIPLDYDALRMCLRKINHTFKGLHVGLPRIGCSLAGGDWEIVREMIKQELVNCKVTVLIK